MPTNSPKRPGHGPRQSLPPNFDSPRIKQPLAKLTNESQALAKLVRANAGDEQIKNSLTARHDWVHEIVELWNDQGSP